MMSTKCPDADEVDNAFLWYIKKCELVFFLCLGKTILLLADCLLQLLESKRCDLSVEAHRLGALNKDLRKFNSGFARIKERLQQFSIKHALECTLLAPCRQK